MIERSPMGQRLEAEFRRLGLQQKDVALYCGVTPQAVSKWLQADNLKREHEPHLRALGVNVGYVLAPSQVTEPLAEYAQVDAPPARRIPITSYVRGGPEGYFEPMGEIEGEYVETHVRSARVYAMRVRGDSMRPRIRDGEIIVVDPDAACLPENDIVVRLNNGEIMVKELLIEKPDAIVVSSINNGDRRTIAHADIDFIHRVVAIVPR